MIAVFPFDRYFSHFLVVVVDADSLIVIDHVQPAL